MSDSLSGRYPSTAPDPHVVREQEAQLRLFASHLPAVIWATDTDLRVTSISGSVVDRLIAPPQKFVGATPEEIIGPNYAEHPVFLAHQAALAGQTQSFRHRHQHTYTFQVHLEPLQGSDDEIFGVIGIALDVTKQDQTEAQLVSINQHVSEGIYRSTPTHGLVYVNKAFYQMFGYESAEEMLGLSSESLYADPTLRPHLIAQSEAKGGVQGVEVEIRCKDGSTSWVLMSSTPVFNDDGSVRYYDGVLTDIGKLKKTEAELRASNHFSERIASASPHIIYVFDLQAQQAVYVNARIADMLGYTPDDGIAEPGFFAQVIHPEDLERVTAFFTHFLNTADDETRSKHYRVRHADGSWRWLESHNAVFARDADGRVTQMLGIAQDITDRKKAEAELLQAKDEAEKMNRLKSAFLANMSHEIRTPLTGILGFSQILSEELPQEHQEIADLIGHSGRRLMDTLNSVLDLSMLESGTLKLFYEPFDVAHEAEQRIRMLEHLAEAKELRLQLDAPETPVVARLDRACFGRILDNLIGNAVKFTVDGHVCVRLRTDTADTLVLAVEDTGIGISKSFQPFLFDAFKQESMGIDRRHEGSGLGLSITKRLVDLMGGTIGVTSDKGAGCTFTLRFPGALALPDAATPPLRPQVPDPLPIPARLLVVEDNADTLVLLRLLLDASYDLVLVDNEKDAWDLLNQQTFDLLLLDINLGTDRTGEDLLRDLRQHDRFAHLPVVALTAYALPDDRDRFLAAGFDEYVAKPFTPEHLRRTIHTLVTA